MRRILAEVCPPLLPPVAASDLESSLLRADFAGGMIGSGAVEARTRRLVFDQQRGNVFARVIVYGMVEMFVNRDAYRDGRLMLQIEGVAKVVRTEKGGG